MTKGVGDACIGCCGDGVDVPAAHAQMRASEVGSIVDYENGTLKGQWDPMDRYFKHFALVRVASDWFVPGVYDSE